MKKLIKNQLGFTLIELLVVIAIIGILAAVVVLAINPVQMMQKSRDAQRKTDLATLSRAIDVYMADANASTVPGAASSTRTSYYSGTALTCCNGDADNTDTCDATNSINAVYGGWLVADAAGCTGTNISNYIAKIPNDPNGTTAGGSYQYITNAAASKYSLCVDTELNGASSEVFKVGTDVSMCTLTAGSR